MRKKRYANFRNTLTIKLVFEMVATMKGATMFRKSMENDLNSTKILNLNETLPNIEVMTHKNAKEL